MLIGNLTRDPELRYTPSGTAVCSFGLATNRSWTPSDSSERREETEFHRIVAWNKLAELCSQLLSKGRKVYIEGRLQTRSWEGQDGAKKYTQIQNPPNPAGFVVNILLFQLEHKLCFWN